MLSYQSISQMDRESIFCLALTFGLQKVGMLVDQIRLLTRGRRCIEGPHAS
jgi:hypothetical protein